MTFEEGTYSIAPMVHYTVWGEGGGRVERELVTMIVKLGVAQNHLRTLEGQMR